MVKLLAEPCPRCEWIYQGFHICLDLPKNVMQRVEDGYERDSNGAMVQDDLTSKVKKTRAKNAAESHRAAISAGIRAKWENDPKRIRRDEEIVRLYDKEQMSVREVSDKMNLSQKTVMSALHRAQDRREVTIRAAVRRNRVA